MNKLWVYAISLILCQHLLRTEILPPVYTEEHEPLSSALIQTAVPLNSKYLKTHSSENGGFGRTVHCYVRVVTGCELAGDRVN